jgi:SHS2 domain-containing protein
MNADRAGFELLEHTADVKLHAWGDTRSALFRAAAEGLYSVIGEINLSERAAPATVTIRAPDVTDLFHDWLAELLFLFATQRVKVSDIEFSTITDTELDATVRKVGVDCAGSRFGGEVKAVTYHGLHVERRGGRHEATVILDL